MRSGQPVAEVQQKWRILILILLLICCVMTASGNVLEVPEEYPTIQQALDASASGDTVLVAPGTYPEHLITPDHDLLLCSNFLYTQDSTVVVETVIDAEWTGTAITASSENPIDLRIIGLTIKRGQG